MFGPLSNTIQGVVNMTWPMVIISVIILVSTRVAYLMKNHEKLVLYKELLMLSFIIYILCLFQVVTYQDDVSWATNNYIPLKGIQAVIIGKNLGNITCVAGGTDYTLPTYNVQTLADGSTVKTAITLREDITDIRFNFNSNAEISRIEIYGEAPNELPKVGFTSITTSNWIGEPKVGDVITLTASAATKKLMVYNGTAFE